MTTTINYLYDLDTSGVSAHNRIQKERHTLPTYIPEKYRFIVPRNAPFFTMNYEVYLIDPSTNSKKKLERFTHYAESHPYAALTNQLQKQLCGSIMITDSSLTGTVSIEYNTIGGPFTIDDAKILEILANRATNPVTVDWSQVANVPDKFPAEIHYHPAENLGEYGELVNAVKNNTEAMINETNINSEVLNRHLKDSNPHGITLEGLGAAHIRNTSIATDKEVEDGASILALVTAAALKHFARYYGLQPGGGNGGGSGGIGNDIANELSREIDGIKNSISRVRNYGIAENEEQLNPDASNLYATVQHAYRIIAKRQASLQDAKNEKDNVMIISPAVLHGILNDYMQIGTMFYLPRNLVKSSRCVIPNGARFNTILYPELYNYLGTDYLPQAQGMFVKTYNFGSGQNNQVGNTFNGTSVLGDVNGELTASVNRDGFLVPHYHQVEAFVRSDAITSSENRTFIGKLGDVEGTMPASDVIKRCNLNYNSVVSSDGAKRPDSESLSDKDLRAYEYKVTSLPILNDGKRIPSVISGNSTQPVPINTKLTLTKNWVVPEPQHILLNLVMRAK